MNAIYGIPKSNVSSLECPMGYNGTFCASAMSGLGEMSSLMSCSNWEVIPHCALVHKFDPTHWKKLDFSKTNGENQRTVDRRPQQAWKSM